MSLGFSLMHVTPCLSLFILYLPYSSLHRVDLSLKSSSNPVWMKLSPLIPPLLTTKHPWWCSIILNLATIPLLTLYGPGVLIPELQSLFSLVLLWKNLYLFLVVLGLCCCLQALSSCSEQGLLFSCGARAQCGGFSCRGAQILGCLGSAVAACRISCSTASGLFPEQGSILCPLCWQADS